MDSSFSNSGHSAVLTGTRGNISFDLLSVLNSKTKIKTESRMGSCYSGYYNDHRHAGIICNIEEPRQKCGFGTVNIRLIGGGGEGVAGGRRCAA